MKAIGTCDLQAGGRRADVPRDPECVRYTHSLWSDLTINDFKVLIMLLNFSRLRILY